MNVGLIVLGILLLLVGAVWTGQGANLIGGSFMTGQSLWLGIGLLTAFVGAALIFWARYGSRRLP